MAFSNFKNISEVIQKYQLTYDKRELFINIPDLALPSVILEDFHYSLRQKKPNASEYYLCEAFTSLMLRQVLKHHPNLIFWSHEYTLTYDDELTGTPDYIISYKKDENTYENSPLLTVVEAKRDNFALVWAQALAEMVACQKNNEAIITNPITVYCAVTNGEIWQFGQLEQQQFTQDIHSYSLTRYPQEIAGILNHIFELGIQQMAKW